ncbi:alpha-glucuronidase [Eubacteriales bacterium OttesenSCG-928-A19]|nr:alpha-glucuronidase [Eubacteriales bacterium OttesenSCG-928-A19]
MLNQLQYSEYNAWLQPGGMSLGHALRLTPDGNVPELTVQELRDGLSRLYGPSVWSDGAASVEIALSPDDSLPSEGYRVRFADGRMLLQGNGNGLLYGVFALLRALASGTAFDAVDLESAPAVARRVLNHWDRPDGSVERGYAGASLFFSDGSLSYDPERIQDYARLLSSTGINVIVINNVNVCERGALLITEEMLPRLKALADLIRPYGIRLCVSVHFESPVMVGGLPTSDPLNPDVIRWWQEQTDRLYAAIPDFSGYLVKADSEFRGGPMSMGRTQADGANMLARALAPHDGIVYWRCFIYNCKQDWRDAVTDRPMAAYDLFLPQDGSFLPNVILQIKNGPSDFQVREPNSPLLGAMPRTRQALELQIAQEYTGHQIDVYSLAVHWEEVFSFPTGERGVLRDLIGSAIDTIAGVANVGNDRNWTGHMLAQLNLYAFGRLAWDPTLTAAAITDEWVRQSLGNDPQVVAGVSHILERSRSVYENYTTPFGLGWMVNVHSHYGPSPEGYEYMKWGTYHRANHEAIGVDRTSRGTGFSRQFSPHLTALFDSVRTCPEELLLFFHRIPYTHRLQNGKTLLQELYDRHFEGADDVEGFIERWQALQALLPRETYESVLKRLHMQLENAREWRDVVNTYLYRFTGVPDALGRKIYE